MPTTKVLPCGSFKAIPLQIGKRPDHCCGSTENVPLSTSPALSLLTDFYLYSGFRQECTQARLFHPRLIAAFIVDNPTALRLSMISNPPVTQDPLI